MLKKFLLMGAVAGMFAACSDSSSTQVTQQELLENSDEISSSDEAVESSSSEKSTSSSSQKAEGKEGKSSAKESVESSSSENAEESSSSEESTSSSSQYQVPRLDKLPFDTTGVEFEIFAYESFDGDDTLEYGENTKYIVIAEQTNYASCHVTEVPEGRVGTVYMSSGWPSVYTLIEQNDSLLFADVMYCSTTYGWGDCRDDEFAYTQKIMVGDEVFYYGEFEKRLLLIQLTDSTVSKWIGYNPSYVPPPQNTTMGTTGWKKSWFDGDTLVKFVGDDPSADNVDTIYIEKYSLKITDNQNTWIFENETCTGLGYKASPEMSSEESCYAYAKYRNAAIECIQRNMGTPSNVYPRLCRPLNAATSSYDIWCILDKELSEVRP